MYIYAIVTNNEELDFSECYTNLTKAKAAWQATAKAAHPGDVIRLLTVYMDDDDEQDIIIIEREDDIIA